MQSADLCMVQEGQVIFVKGLERPLSFLKPSTEVGVEVVVIEELCGDAQVEVRCDLGLQAIWCWVGVGKGGGCN